MATHRNKAALSNRAKPPGRWLTGVAFKEEIGRIDAAFHRYPCCL